MSTLIIIKWLQKKNFEVIIFIPVIKNFILKYKIKKLNIKKIYFKNLKYNFIKNYIFLISKISFDINLKNLLYNFLIIKEIMKISFYEKTNYVCYYFKKKNINFELIFKYFNFNIKIIFPWKNFYNKKELLFFLKKNNIIVKKKKSFKKIKRNDLENIIENQNNLDYAIYFTLTIKNGFLLKLNNNFYNIENLYLKLNNLCYISGINNYTIKNNKSNFNFNNYLYASKIINYIFNFLEKKILKKKTLNIKKKICSNYFFLILEGKWWSLERIIFQNIINYIDKNINCIIKLKLYKSLINIIDFYIF